MINGKIGFSLASTTFLRGGSNAQACMAATQGKLSKAFASEFPGTSMALPYAIGYSLKGRSTAAKTRQRLQASAKRLSKEEAAAGQWASLLQEEDRPASDLGSFQNLNELCNKGLKLMLKGDEQGLQDFRDELNVVGSSFSDQKILDGALFIYVMFMMTEHTIVEQAENLTGSYEAAYKQVFSILEDSGWKLVQEGEESEEDGTSFDDIPSLGYIQNMGDMS